MKFWIKIGLALVALWLVAGGIVYFVRGQRPTAESMTAYLQRTDLPAAGAGRERTIRHVEDMLNHLSFEDRQQIDRSGVNRHFFAQLTPDEQGAFLDATLPEGFHQLMESFNNMPSEKRKQMVEHALQQMREHPNQGPPPNDKMAQRMINEGLKSFYRDANADVKLDLAPIIEQMQNNLQRP